MTVRPYGTWPSEIDFDTVSRVQARGFAALDLAGGRVRWAEGRPAEGGRTVIVEWRDGAARDLLPEGFNARTRVHEYGGGAIWYHGDTVFFSEFSTSRLHRLDPQGEPVPITPEPPAPNSLRYADGCVSADGSRLWCVRERHEDEVWNELVTLPADGSAEPAIVASGRDFFSAPRLSPDGRTLAWLAWDHPRMPWDGTELYVADVLPDGALGEPRHLVGGPEESVICPQWSADGLLHFCTDRSGWWNLHRLDADGAERALTSLEDGEIGGPDWVFGLRPYVFLDDGRIACVVTRRAVDSLELLDPESGALAPAGLEFTVYETEALAAGDGKLGIAAASSTEPLALLVWDPATNELERIRRSLAVELDAAAISTAQPLEFPTRDGGVAHAFYYPPKSPGFEGGPDERPPLRVICHGGPTSHRGPGLEPAVQFFTQRGIGVVDVNYRGSSGFGRAFRRLLDGRWGDSDWRDCVDAARFLAEQGEADPARTWVEGGSAGGYVVLCAAVFEPEAFAAGVSLFGVTDLTPFVTDTHKFESRYLDTLVGPYPERADLYRERSPVEFADALARPLLLFQGLDDKIVPPSQAELMVEVLERKRIPYAYLAFAGEGHGFRRRENIRRTLEATLAFVGRVFGFEPADELEPVAIRHL